MKLAGSDLKNHAHTSSHSTRSAWIETKLPRRVRMRGVGRTPHGVRGLKQCSTKTKFGNTKGRTPHGVRGLKR